MQTIRMLGQAEAAAAVAAVTEAAARRSLRVVVAVADAQGELVALLRMDGAMVSSVQVAANKAWTAARLRRPSRAVGTRAPNPKEGFDVLYYGDTRITGFGGGLPVLADGAVVGAVAVSGASSDEDEDLAASGVAAMRLPQGGEETGGEETAR